MTISAKIPRLLDRVPPKWLYIAMFAILMIAPHSCDMLSCHPSCATCSNSSATGCLTCPPYKFLLPSNHSCVTSCPSGYIGNTSTKTCVAIVCHPSCATCSNSSANGCLTCPPYKFLIPSNHTCVSTCPSGYVADSATKTCVVLTCHPSCATCSNSSATGCLTCPPYKFLIPSNHTCVSTCPSGYVADSATKTCVVLTCHPSCATCSNSSATGCLTCPPYKFLIPSNHTCVADCPSGYIEDSATKTCVVLTCHPSCATCSNSSATGCLTCPPYKFLIPSNHTCVATCPSGYVADHVTKTCVVLTCHPSCATCSNSSANGCLTCPPYKFLIPSNHTCVADCPSGYIEDHVTKTCVVLTCHPSCATCSNSSANGCLTCPPGKFYIPSNHSCVSLCPPAWCGSGNTCVSCHPSCATCSNSSATGCLTGSGSYYFWAANHTCLSSCPVGYYGDSATHTCKPCHSSCRTCSNGSSNGCLSCSSPLFFLAANHSCCSSCPSGTTPNSVTRVCVPFTCHPSCATCSGSGEDDCLTCTSAAPVQCGGYCQVPCAGYYNQKQMFCHQCHPSCNGCSLGARNCIQCASGYVRIGINGPCVPHHSRMIRLRE